MNLFLHLIRKGFTAIAFTAVAGISTAKAQCASFTNMKQEMVSNLSIGAGGYFTGLLRWLPADYAVNTSKKYPVIIYFHGASATGNGSATDLCKIITDAPSSLPYKIENNEITNSFAVGSDTYSYIFISPQYSSYGAGQEYHSNDVDALLNYVIANYRVDTTRIYLTGMSSGANLAIDYVANSVAKASRIAAVSVASLCYATSFTPTGPATIAASHLPVWFVHCELDNPCVVSIPDDWVSGINSNSPNPAPVYSRLAPMPAGNSGELIYCHFSFYHDTWRSLYSPTFTQAGGANMYQWLLQNQRVAVTLPVTLKDFGAKLVNGKVTLRWTTASENNSASFRLERAGSDQRYTTLATLPAAGNSSTEKAYEFIDERPLANLSFYRLLQTDADGNKKYFDARKIMNKTGQSNLLVFPNPFHNNLSAFITLNKSQQVTITVTDISGRIMATQHQLFAEGSTELSIPFTSLRNGVYYVNATGPGISVSQKIIKQ